MTIPVSAAKSPFGPFAASDVELLGRELLPPLLVVHGQLAFALEHLTSGGAAHLFATDMPDGLASALPPEPPVSVSAAQLQIDKRDHIANIAMPPSAAVP